MALNSCIACRISAMAIQDIAQMGRNMAPLAANELQKQQSTQKIVGKPLPKESSSKIKEIELSKDTKKKSMRDLFLLRSFLEINL